MRRTPGRIALLLVALMSVASLAACKSDDSTTATSGGTTTTNAGGAGGAGVTFSGDLSGTMTLGLCTGKIGSLRVNVTGDSTTYLGSVSGISMGFVGPNGGPFAVPTSGKKPTVASDGNSFKVTGVVLKDNTLTHKSITVNGTLTCP